MKVREDNDGAQEGHKHFSNNEYEVEKMKVMSTLEFCHAALVCSISHYAMKRTDRRSDTALSDQCKHKLSTNQHNAILHAEF